MNNTEKFSKEMMKEYQVISYYDELARKNIFKKRGLIFHIIKNIPLFIFPSLSINSPRWTDKEVEQEYNRLMEVEGNKILHKIRPDLY